MKKINIIIPRVSKNTFTGGTLCLMEYARGLAKKGHDVKIIPILPSPIKLNWFNPDPASIEAISKIQYLLKTINKIPSIVASVSRILLKKSSESDIKNIQDLFGIVNLFFASAALPYEIKYSLGLYYLKKVMLNADVTIATSYETALPVKLYGSGALYYFVQHYEPYFKNEKDNPILAEYHAKSSYLLNLNTIANSSWLKEKIKSEHNVNGIVVCPNAINHELFNGMPKQNENENEIIVISYGGRNAEWKGFKEMAKAVKQARQRLPNKKIVWRVYGDVLLPPENPIANYERLGFLQPYQLAEAYRKADILLSASWYESFPLFPLEAMACGLAVITTQYGTEDYAIHQETAEIVQPKNPDSICEAIIRLTTDSKYRKKLAINGQQISKKFTWDKSIKKFEEIILGN